MKPLPDPHCFDGIEAREYHREGAECYRTVERHRFLQYRHPVRPSDDMLLGCPLLCRTRSWSGDYHYRRNPPFLTVTLIHSGEMAFRTAALSGIAEPGDLVLFPPRTEYEFMTPTRCERSAVLLEGSLLDALLPVLRQTVTLDDTSVPEHAMTAIGAALQESSLPEAEDFRALLLPAAIPRRAGTGGDPAGMSEGGALRNGTELRPAAFGRRTGEETQHHPLRPDPDVPEIPEDHALSAFAATPDGTGGETA